MFGKPLAVLAALALSGCNIAAAASQSIKFEDTQPSDAMARFGKVCKDFDDWDKPISPFQIYGNTWYVGTCGIAAILITTDDGHALIDTGTEAGAEVVLANIQSLGFDPKDIKGLLTSHEHFDHVGGIARMEAATGGQVITSELAAFLLAYGEDALRSSAAYGIDIAIDPQAGMHEPMARVAGAMPYTSRRAADLLRSLGVTGYPTPGHTPGALTWQWDSCVGTDCKTIVYADSLSPISSDDYRFSDHPEYVAAFRAGLERLRGLKCDILLTPHPSASDMLARARTGSLEGGMSCAQYADSKARALDDRLAKESAAQ